MRDVAVVRWPAERRRRDELARCGQPRLLLVEAQAPPPVSSDPLEDWAREPCSDLDVRARLDGLRMRLLRAMEAVPELDEHGVIRFGDRWAPLPPVEARLTAVLVRRFRAVVSREDLVAAGWPGGDPDRNTLDVHVLRLRRRLEPVQLAIHTVRSRGYLLEPSLAGLGS